MFPPAGYHEVYRRARVFYDFAGAGDRFEEEDHDAPHGDGIPLRKYAREWVTRWLGGGRIQVDEDQGKPVDVSRLTVLDQRPANSRNDAIQSTFIRTATLRPQATLAGWKRRRTELMADLEDKVFRAFPKTKTPLSAWRATETGWTGFYADSWNVEFTTEESIRVTGQLFVPRGPARAWPALIDVRGADDIVYPVDYDFILPALGKYVVLVLNPRAVDYPVDNFRMATMKRTAAMVGATIESMQVWDILRSVDFLVDAEKLRLESISVYGRREMGALGLYAAAFDPRITRVVLDNPPGSHWQGPALLNVLRITDLAEVAALVAPRDVVSLTPLPEPYSYTASIFALYGAKGHMQHRNGLSEALGIGQPQRGTARTTRRLGPPTETVAQRPRY